MYWGLEVLEYLTYANVVPIGLRLGGDRVQIRHVLVVVAVGEAIIYLAAFYIFELYGTKATK